MVGRDIVSAAPGVGKRRGVAESRCAEASDVRGDARRGRGSRAFNGDLAGGGLQGGVDREGVGMEGVVAGVQREEGGRRTESVGEEGGRGVGAHGEGWAINV